ncbi:hypothetical protein BTR23_09330 [Alkalihalophilus pseudofirmus]|uniref:enoyl-CoA hydratase n=1 Tax=Alkalihalobacterium alkalinitrilicum TaxID=427920 RepID=UPI00094CBB7B|nr:enoyl-CoA hydratase [Alkalihalobacterium alkalinitrilicum]OLO39240.1 hypothetical protein BTR23_09330 [Alkalihalophilus pseudofirmus]
MDFNTIIYKELVNEGIAEIIMNRPKKRNAINKEMIVEMSAAFKRAEESEDIKVIIFSGAGPCFSAGHDLSPNEEYPDTCDERIAFERKYYFDESMYIRNIRKPIISKVHSHCIAAALALASVTDIVIASEDAIFSEPVVRMGANSQELMFLPWLIGEKKTKELLFTGDAIKADEAVQLGLVNKVVPVEQLDDAVMEMASKIAQMPPLAISLVKESVNNTMDIMGYTNSMKMHFASHLLSHTTNEIAEGMGKSKRGNLKEFFDRRDQKFV